MNDDEYDDPSYDDIRALLGAAKATGAVPDEVAARLDATLAELTADRVPTAAQVVVPLRRRRLAPRLLVAAAAIVVVGAGGVAVNQLIGSSEPASMASSDAGGPAPSIASVPRPELAPESVGTGTGGTAGRTPAEHLNLQRSTAIQFRTATFAKNAAQFVGVTGDFAALVTGKKDDGRSPGVPGAAAPSGAPTAPAPGTDDVQRDQSYSAHNELDGVTGLTGLAAKACTGPVDPSGPTYPIKLDDKPAVLVVYPATDGYRLVSAWSCDGSAVLASTSVPVR